MNKTAFQTYGLKKSLAFVSTWNTSNVSTGSSTSTQIKLPLETTGTYNFYVDWGDGSSLQNITSGATQPVHTYSVAGTYTISITGIISGFSFGSSANNTSSDKLKIISISKWGCLKLGNSGSYFSGCQNVTLNTITDTLNLTGTTTLAAMFFDCRLMSTVGRMNEWNLSNVTNLSNMFQMLVLSGSNGIGLFNQDIGAWNVSNVTNFSGMFRFCGQFNNGDIDNIKNWNMSSAILVNDMFSRASKFNQPIANWERSTVGNTSTLVNVTNTTNMFNAAAIFNQPIGNWNVSNVTNMTGMFYQSIFNQNIGAWNVKKVSAFANFGVTGNGRTPFSPAMLDAIYQGWSTITGLVPGCNLQFTSQYTTAGGASGKAILVGPPNNWIITDGGPI